MPTEELLFVQLVTLTTTIDSIISRAGVRVNCQQCGEEIINEREIIQSDQFLCQACAGPAYYQIAPTDELVADLLFSNRLVVGKKNEVLRDH